MLCTIVANRYSANLNAFFSPAATLRLPLRAGESRKDGRSRAFFSLDAMLALAMAVFAFASFSLLLSSAGALAASQSRQASSGALAIGFSSHILDKCSAKPSYESPGSYSKTNELDSDCLRSLPLQDALAVSGKNFASASVRGAGGEFMRFEHGAKGAEVFCARRLVLVSGKISLLEACLS